MFMRIKTTCSEVERIVVFVIAFIMIIGGSVYLKSTGYKGPTSSVLGRYTNNIELREAKESIISEANILAVYTSEKAEDIEEFIKCFNAAVGEKEAIVYSCVLDDEKRTIDTIQKELDNQEKTINEISKIAEGHPELQDNFEYTYLANRIAQDSNKIRNAAKQYNDACDKFSEAGGTAKIEKIKVN